MIQEDKQLLIKDLCARLPYKIKVKTPYNDTILVGIVNRKGIRKDIDYIDVVTDKQTYPIRYIKPYLRPMSSMTEEETEIFNSDFGGIGDGYNSIEIKRVDWLNANHFDYRGLIEKGLALKALEGMYK